MLEFYPGRVLRLSCDRGDRVGAKIKTENNPQHFHQNPKKSLDQKLTPKKSHAKFLSLKISQKALKGITQKINWKVNVCICGWDSRAQPPIFHIVLNTPKSSYLHSCKSSHPKKYLSNFPTQKNPGNENFKPPKILLSSKVPPGEL